MNGNREEKNKSFQHELVTVDAGLQFRARLVESHFHFVEGVCLQVLGLLV